MGQKVVEPRGSDVPEGHLPVEVWPSLPSLETAVDWFELNLLEPTVSVLTHPAISGSLGRGFRFGTRAVHDPMYDGCDLYGGCDPYVMDPYSYAPPSGGRLPSSDAWRTAPING